MKFIDKQNITGRDQSVHMALNTQRIDLQKAIATTVNCNKL